jgi:hypothetical protein
VTNPRPDGTNADAGVTNPAAGRGALDRWTARLAHLPARPVQFALVALPMLVNAAINSASVAIDLTRRGADFHPIEPWIWEFSSAAAMLLWLLPVLWLDEALRARTEHWAMRLGVRVLASVAFSAAHVATMVGLRLAIYRVAGWHYDFGPWRDGFVYEYRKDAMTYALIIGLAAVWRLLIARQALVGGAAANDVVVASAVVPAPAAPVPPPSAPTFLVRTTQGDLLVRAQDIDWIEAQGNYVALHVQNTPRLLRHTLAEMETRLAEHGFIRTHRRALVNRERVQAIIPPELGELGVRLSSGEVVPLSESRRAEVLRLVVGATPAG